MKKQITLFACSLFMLVTIFSSCQKENIDAIEQQEEVTIETNLEERRRPVLQVKPPTASYPDVDCTFTTCPPGSVSVTATTLNGPTARVTLNPSCMSSIGPGVDIDFYLINQYDQVVSYNTGPFNQYTFPINQFDCGTHTVLVTFFDQTVNPPVHRCISRSTILLTYPNPEAC